jgi:iron(III) transport system substrate-binding protein
MTAGLLALAAAVGLLLAAGCRQESASPAAEVVVYCSVDEDVASPILADFEKSTGVHVVARYDSESGKTTGLAQKLRTEAARPAADVYWSGEVFHTVRLARDGVLEPFEPERVKSWPAGLADPEGRWYGFGLRARVLGYNTRRLTADEAPNRLEDLLDPKWKGRIVMGTPEFGTTCGHVASWYAWYGEARATEILRGLRANDIRLVAGNSLAVQDVANGKADICLTDTDDCLSAMREKWPVGLKALRHGDGGSLQIPLTAALVKGGPHPQAGRQLMAAILNADTERALARSGLRCVPVREELRAEFPDLPLLGARLPVDYGKVADSIPAALVKAPKLLTE